MSEELAKSVVLIAQRMENEDHRLIAIIRYNKGDVYGSYRIEYPKEKKFYTIEGAHNWLVGEGFQEAGSEESSHWMNVIERDNRSYGEPVMIMWKQFVEKIE